MVSILIYLYNSFISQILQSQPIVHSQKKLPLMSDEDLETSVAELSGEASINAMNGCKPGKQFLPCVKLSDLTVGATYEAKTIRKVKTKFGGAYVVESTDFQVFLPSYFNKIEIPDFIERRCFMVKKATSNNGRSSSELYFFMN